MTNAVISAEKTVWWGGLRRQAPGVLLFVLEPLPVHNSPGLLSRGLYVVNPLLCITQQDNHLLQHSTWVLAYVCKMYLI